MKKYLLIPILVIIFAIPAFSAFPSGDMNNTHIEGNTTSSNMPSQNTYKQRKKSNNENNLNSENTLGDSKSSDNRKSSHPHAKNVQETQKKGEDENDNLKNIAQSAPANIQNNLRIPDGESSRLNREMMLNGPQGGIQNNQPRGIGSASY